MGRKQRNNPRRKTPAHSDAQRATDKFAAGEFATAAKHCRNALASNPRSAELWHLLAACLLSIEQFTEAAEAVAHARDLAPGNPEYRNTDALIAERRGMPDLAETALRELLRDHPQHIDACYNLGRLLLARGEFAEATLWFKGACTLRPGWGEALKNLGHACFGLKAYAAAEGAFTQALQVVADDADALINLSRLAHLNDDFDAAAVYLRRAVDAHPDSSALLRLAMLKPIFNASAAEIGKHRARIMHDLELIAAERLTFVEPAKLIGAPSFYFAYDGLNDRPLMSTVGDIIDSAWQRDPLPVIRRGRQRPRVAFVSAHLKHHAIGRLYAPLIEQLPRDDFEVCVLSVGRHDDGYSRRIAAAADVSMEVDKDHASARSALGELGADIIFYPDIGMDATTYWLAAERLAPVQAMGWGHPVTSGFRSMDYFVSSALLEPGDADDHYRETLVRLPTWPVIYDSPGTPDAAAFRRADAGFQPHERLYLCPQSLFKVHPDFDVYLAEILRLDNAARIVFVSSNDAWTKKLASRFVARMGDAASRICFLPALSTAAFYTLISVADVVLDTIHFSGGVTSFESIWAETPFVTERSAFMRGRVTAALCDLLGLDDAVTLGADAYAARAVALAHAGPVRDAFVANLRDRKGQLLELGDGVAKAYQDFFIDALQRRDGQLGKLAS